MSYQTALSFDEEKISKVWNEHLRKEFGAHSPREALATMTANPRVNQIPAESGKSTGRGSTERAIGCR